MKISPPSIEAETWTFAVLGRGVGLNDRAACFGVVGAGTAAELMKSSRAGFELEAPKSRASEVFRTLSEYRDPTVKAGHSVQFPRALAMVSSFDPELLPAPAEITPATPTKRRELVFVFQVCVHATKYKALSLSTTV
jgi:hypothetical protein